MEDGSGRSQSPVAGKFLLSGSIIDHAIRERAYHLWIAYGQPEGNADVYWLAAQREILATTLDLAETAVSPSMHSESATTKTVKSQGVPDRENANLALHSDLLISRQLPLSPMVVFAVRIEHPLDVSTLCQWRVNR
jgi:Protein of unknown function (DUF2934)